MNRLVLFDVDGTLLGSAETHHLAFCKAFKRVYDVDIQPSDIICRSGMTDQEVIYDIFEERGLDVEYVDTKINECMKVMIDSFKEMEKEVKVLVGVPELLERLDKYNILMGLVTGNLEPIAKEKLEKAGLNRYFKVGGFGSDAIDRAELVKLAVKRAGENCGFERNDNVCLFGDAPQDINAAKKNKVKAIGVTTGNYSKEDLKKAGADFIFENLRSTDEILEAIRS